MFYELMGLAVTAAITENIVFCRGLEHGLHTKRERGFKDICRLGAMATLLTTIAAFCGWFGRFATENWLTTLLSWTRPAVFIAVYGASIVLLMVGMNFCQSLVDIKGKKIATKLVYGFVPLGTLFIVGNSSMGGWQSLVYGFGAGVGFLLAALINLGLQRRLEHSDMPMVFRGMPATILTLGLLSLGIFGLLGHPLAA